VLNPKAGRETTNAVNIATLIAARDESVLLVDADPQGSALQWSETVDLGFPAVSLPVKTSASPCPTVAQGRANLVIDTRPATLALSGHRRLRQTRSSSWSHRRSPTYANSGDTFELLTDMDEHDPRLSVVLTRLRPAQSALGVPERCEGAS
jgi:hypothetical protein